LLLQQEYVHDEIISYNLLCQLGQLLSEDPLSDGLSEPLYKTKQYPINSNIVVLTTTTNDDDYNYSCNAGFYSHT
jgi:hypothetical protein